MTLKFYTILKFMERLLFRLHSRVKKIQILSWIMSLDTFMKKKLSNIKNNTCTFLTRICKNFMRKKEYSCLV